MKFSLENIQTKDKLILNGLFCNSKKNYAVLFVHGFPGNFYGNENILDCFVDLNFSVLSLNTRGHDILSITRKNNNEYIISGSAVESFDDCTLDIDAGINFLKKAGFTNIFLAAISAGTDKIGYYLSKKKNNLINGAIFISPGSNIVAIKKEVGKSFNLLLKKSIEMVNKKRGDELIINKKMDFPVSYKRFISLYDENSNENVFPFHNKNSEFKTLSLIKKPMLFIMGENDVYLYGTDPDTIMSLLKNKLPNQFNAFKGANHSFQKKERELASIIKNWSKSITGKT
jgi:pimeloyl-ACP methyl ester carboxylesterase